jgi:hypothetical protein
MKSYLVRYAGSVAHHARPTSWWLTLINQQAWYRTRGPVYQNNKQFMIWQKKGAWLVGIQCHGHGGLVLQQMQLGR